MCPVAFAHRGDDWVADRSFRPTRLHSVTPRPRPAGLPGPGTCSQSVSIGGATVSGAVGAVTPSREWTGGLSAPVRRACGCRPSWLFGQSPDPPPGSRPDPPATSRFHGPITQLTAVADSGRSHRIRGSGPHRFPHSTADQHTERRTPSERSRAPIAASRQHVSRARGRIFCHPCDQYSRFCAVGGTHPTAGIAPRCS